MYFYPYVEIYQDQIDLYSVILSFQYTGHDVRMLCYVINGVRSFVSINVNLKTKIDLCREGDVGRDV